MIVLRDLLATGVARVGQHAGDSSRCTGIADFSVCSRGGETGVVVTECMGVKHISSIAGPVCAMMGTSALVFSRTTHKQAKFPPEVGALVSHMFASSSRGQRRLSG
jgi:hypothetical protein